MDEPKPLPVADSGSDVPAEATYGPLGIPASMTTSSTEESASGAESSSSDDVVEGAIPSEPDEPRMSPPRISQSQPQNPKVTEEQVRGVIDQNSAFFKEQKANYLLREAIDLAGIMKGLLVAIPVMVIFIAIFGIVFGLIAQSRAPVMTPEELREYEKAMVFVSMMACWEADCGLSANDARLTDSTISAQAPCIRACADKAAQIYEHIFGEFGK